MKTLVIALALVLTAACSNSTAAEPRLTFACRVDNDLFTALQDVHDSIARFDTTAAAIEAARDESAVLLLADGYPSVRVSLDAKLLGVAKEKRLRLFLEYPESLPGLTFETPRGATWERLAVASDELGDALTRLRILTAHECRFLPVANVQEPWLVLARIAGYDSAVYGLPKESFPILFEAPDLNALVATTKLSHFITGRYAPTAQWRALWTHILRWLDPAGEAIAPEWSPLVGVALKPDAPVEAQQERETVDRAAGWLINSRLLVTEDQLPELVQQLSQNAAVRTAPQSRTIGDGSHGILEGYTSGILIDGTQLQCLPIRFDCQAESAMVLALSKTPDHQRIAENLLNYAFFTSDMQRNGARGDPRHPSYGLLAWGTHSPAWKVANYGDDNARSILSAVLASSALKDDRWDASILTALYANLRTTGKLGFRGDRIDQPQLEDLGWKHFHDAETVNISPHFEAYLWACYLWAYEQTRDAAFLDRTKTAIRMTMDAYPKKGWRWNSNLERAHMLLSLAWLVRVEDTPEHRKWLSTIASDLLAAQVECGAIQEQLSHVKGGHFSVPQTNEDYGVGETPLVQAETDPVSDQLYTTGFALLALHEAFGATGDEALLQAENQLAAYLCRIQTRSKAFPQFDGWWFRAFDYEKWEAYASSADIGWGAWSLEAGWAQAWTTATLALRTRKTTFWDFTSENTIEKHLPAVREKLSVNTGGPWTQ